MRASPLSRKTILPAVVLTFAALCASLWWFTRPVSTPSSGSDRPTPLFPPPAESPREPQRLPTLAAPPARPPAEPKPTAEPVPGKRADTPPAPAVPEKGLAAESSTRAAAPSSAGDSEPPVSKEEVKAAVQSVKPLIRQCFEDVAQRYPGNHKVVLKFTIVGQGLTGHFKDGEVVDTTIPDPWLQACFLDSLTDARFPAPSGGGTVTVTYPFSYVADPEDAGSPEGR